MADIFAKFQNMITRHGEIISATGIDPLSVRMERVISPTQAVIDGRECILLGSNNYLGLTFEPEAVDAAKNALDEYGTGTTGSRVANGSYASHQELEKQIAAFYGMDHAILFTTGYQANVGFISAIAGKDDVILMDADSHASIYDGVRLGQATVMAFRHNNAEDLERRLKRLSPDVNKLVIVEGIYSMLGDRAPLKEIVTVAKKYGAYILVDEAHSLGVLGQTGRGLAQEAGVEDDIDFIVGTFSKSVGTIGGFCVSNHAALNTVRFAARAYMFTASLPPSVVASASRTLKRIGEDRSLQEKLWENAAMLYDGLVARGFTVGPEKTPVIGVQLPDVQSALMAWRFLLENNVYVNLALPPATPNGASLLRCSVCASHTQEQLEKILDVFGALLAFLSQSAAAE